MRWDELLPLLHDFWQQARRKLGPRYAPAAPRRNREAGASVRFARLVVTQP